jgi:hypothetical protein
LQSEKCVSNRLVLSLRARFSNLGFSEMLEPGSNGHAAVLQQRCFARKQRTVFHASPQQHRRCFPSSSRHAWLANIFKNFSHAATVGIILQCVDNG